MIRILAAAAIGVSISFSAIAEEAVSAILSSGGDNAAEQICSASVESAEKAAAAIVTVAREKFSLLRPVMECIYWRVEPEVFDQAVVSAVATLRGDGE